MRSPARSEAGGANVSGVVKLGRFILYIATIAALALVAVASANAGQY